MRVPVEHGQLIVKTKYRREYPHIRCLACGEYWHEKDAEGTFLPLSYCPNCGAMFIGAENPEAE